MPVNYLISRMFISESNDRGESQNETISTSREATLELPLLICQRESVPEFLD